MSNRLPILDELAAKTTDAERGEWLNACPLYVIAHYSADIRTIFDAEGFEAGNKALDAERALLFSTRNPADGSFKQGPLFDAHLAKVDLRIACKKRRAAE
jgi:hypothetical protein